MKDKIQAKSDGAIVRFAPSPTGYLHVGGARTAIFNWLLARNTGGSFLMRIEDTDQQRSTIEAEKQILESLQWLGLDWDGDIYYQSQHQQRHVQVAEELLQSGNAYRCFCKKEDQSENVENPDRRDPCRFLTVEDVSDRLHEGDSFVIRQRIPEGGSTTFTDAVYGEITIANSQLADQVTQQPLVGAERIR